MSRALSILLLSCLTAFAQFDNVAVLGSLMEDPAVTSDPSLPSGVVFDWDARFNVYTDEGTTPATDGQSVQWWVDTVGGYKGTNNIAGNRPTYISSWSNGKPALKFDAVDDHLKTAYRGTDNDFTIFAIVGSYNVSNFRRIVDKDYNSGFWLGLRGGSSTGGTNAGGGFKQIADPYGTYTHIPTAKTNAYMVMLTKNTTTLTAITQFATNNTGSVANTAMSTTNIMIGVDANVAAGSLWNGYISRIVYWNRSLTASEWGTLTNIAKVVYNLP